MLLEAHQGVQTAAIIPLDIVHLVEAIATPLQDLVLLHAPALPPAEAAREEDN